MQARRKQQFAGGRGSRGDASSVSLQTILLQARKSGQLNLSNRSFTEGMFGSVRYDMIWYDAWFALENWQASCPFNLADKLKRTENVLKGNEMRETEMEVQLCITHNRVMYNSVCS